MGQSEPNVSLQDVVSLSPDVVFRTLEGEVVLLNLQSGVYFGLNETGTTIWNFLNENGSLEATHSQMVKQYAVEPEVAKRDLLQLISSLLEKGLITLRAQSSD